jgi:hypothetical protein
MILESAYSMDYLILKQKPYNNLSLIKKSCKVLLFFGMNLT